ncbi:hypothetical protein CLAFUW4_14640 [Fulvia fulva]|uniref:Uncharacterized protein n=1 Tax=Passalora fulva TaxID=5499 RepID=A0A9Q8PLZ9_PASFU|nr:uncharacterized protein CLAFUR5_14467 [Fulvia fulva]KAK4609555.1 hypothetical protein CLAFUR0_14633 [Fulvia fulva]UJO24990.1 hypothetical protein CLAFUR5_14467 [Fulvia fulva]WPV22684.1 hypothetical protein CLAFUW4_14640 [Fulvia fulva]
MDPTLMPDIAAPMPGDPIGWLEKIIVFPDGVSLLRLHPLSDYRRGEEEARILYLCRKFTGIQNDPGGYAFVMKIKVQVPKSEGGKADPLDGPSDRSMAEMQAMMKFRDADLDCTPDLRWTLQQAQPGDGPVPGGYVTVIVMNQMPGSSLEELKFWSLKEEEQNMIREKFSNNLRSVWKCGIVPTDCSMRNIFWDAKAQKCSIIGFERHRAMSPNVSQIDEAAIRGELPQWGLV